MAEAIVATEGVFNPDITLRSLLDNVRANLKTKYTTVDAAEQLAAQMKAESGQINQTILDITNIMARVHNGETSKADAIAEATPLVKVIKDHCVALHLEDSLAPDGDICETELKMLKEFTAQSIILVDQHIAALKANEGSDGEGLAATLADGAASESLFECMLKGKTAACESYLKESGNTMNSIDMMGMDYAQEGIGEDLGNGLKSIGNAIKAAAKKVWEFLKRIVRWCIDKIKALANWVKNTAIAAWNKFVSLVKAFCGFIKAKMKQLWAFLLKIIAWAKQKGAEGIAAVKQKFSELKAAITNKIEEIKTIHAAKKAAAEAVKNGQVPPEAIKEVQDVCDEAADMAGKLEKMDVPEEAKTEATGLLSTVRSVGSKLGGLIGALKSKVTGEGSPSEDSVMNTDMDAISMARTAAKAGDYEGAIESLISVITGQPAPQKNEEEDAAIEATLLELALMDE